VNYVERTGSNQSGQIFAYLSLGRGDRAMALSLAEEAIAYLCVQRAELAQLSGDDAARQGRLREAHRLFVEMGATGRAAEISAQLAG
jgi:hypothetical protein